MKLLTIICISMSQLQSSLMLFIFSACTLIKLVFPAIRNLFPFIRRKVGRGAPTRTRETL